MFFELIQSQTETVMLAEVRPEYVFKTIDPASSRRKEQAQPRLNLCPWGHFWGMLGVVMVLMRRYACPDSGA